MKKGVIDTMEVNSLWLFSPMLTNVLICTHMIRAAWERTKKMKPRLFLNSWLQLSSNLQAFTEPQKIPFYKTDHKIRDFSKQLINLHNKYEVVNMPGSRWALQVEQLLHIDMRSTFSKWPVHWVWYAALCALLPWIHFPFVSISIEVEKYWFWGKPFAD